MSSKAGNDGRWYRIRPLDSWFFRESRPHGAAGGSELGSLFPPPARTIAGVLRTMIGEQISVDWQAFNTGNGKSHRLESELDLIEEIGDAKGFGKLRLQGPYLHCMGKMLFRAPLHLLKRKGDSVTALQITGNPTRCDLGTVMLPRLADATCGEKQLDGCWITRDGMQAVLNGAVPEAGQLVLPGQLLAPESRLGIARDYAARSAADGMLYQTQHLRLADGLSLLVGISGISDQLLPAGPAQLRFGGEGRLAEISPLLQPENDAELDFRYLDKANAKGILLVLMTDALLQHAEVPAWLPDGFQAEERSGPLCWTGQLNGVPLRIISAVIGKSRREGGWDVAGHQPRPVRSMVPAGSAYFCELADGALTEQALQALHGSHIGTETEIGRGELAAGIWK